MAAYGEDVLFPDKSLYLIHRIRDETSLGRISQWQTRPKNLRATLPPSGIASVSESTGKRDVATTAKIRFIDYNKKGSQTRRKKKPPQTSNITTFHIQRKPPVCEQPSQLRQQSKNASRDQNQNARDHVPRLRAISENEVLNLAMPALSDKMPPSLSHHIILYINYCE